MMPTTTELRCPRHPWVVYFPLTLLGMSFVFDVLSLVRLGPVMVEAARYNLIGGLASAVIACATGVYDYFTRLPAGGAGRRIGRGHAATVVTAMTLFGLSLYLRQQALGAPVTPRAPLVLSAVGVVLLGVAGYLGGVVVVNYASLTSSPRSLRDPR